MFNMQNEYRYQEQILVIYSLTSHIWFYNHYLPLKLLVLCSWGVYYALDLLLVLVFLICHCLPTSDGSWAYRRVSRWLLIAPPNLRPSFSANADNLISTDGP